MMYDFIFNSRYDQSLVRILEIIWKDLRVESEQMPSMTKNQIFNRICSNLKNKSAFAVHKMDVVFYVTPDTPWVGRINIFSVDEGNSMRQRLKAASELTSYIFRNTKLEKIYGVTANKKFLALGKYAKWKPGQEGVLTKSYRTDDGKFIDQYLISVNRSEYMP